MESTSSLTVQTHNFGEGLSNDHFHAVVEEVAEAESVVVEVAGGEAVVGGVEEGVEPVLFADFEDLFPLVFGWVYTGGVVGAGVEEDCGAGGAFGEILEHAFDIETFSGGFKVSIVTGLNTSSSEHSFMVTPSRIRNIKWSRSKLRQEFSDDAESTRSRQCLASNNTA